jgi:hypothetical protein
MLSRPAKGFFHVYEWSIIVPVDKLMEHFGDSEYLTGYEQKEGVNFVILKYIGSTHQNIERRFAEHKNNPTSVERNRQRIANGEKLKKRGHYPTHLIFICETYAKRLTNGEKIKKVYKTYDFQEDREFNPATGKWSITENDKKRMHYKENKKILEAKEFMKSTRQITMGGVDQNCDTIVINKKSGMESKLYEDYLLTKEL